MFSTGQIIFASLFAIAFAIVVILSYKKDKKLHSRNYKGVKWIAFGFAVFVGLLFFIKFFLKN
ncbi:MAG: hypothetical protein CML04_08510 [Pseudozobellia sp.]|nr:hypothetical protein [Pseudozobellia sp.]MBG48679.1 hypothetical protein [Pseudozobellia sp.]MBG50696.1 hypothetical protein [Pseudozobellia sp.]|tara:strand:- start:182 stop:370 length:189 start_codon:yes stop_codon:yes gene_type:complete